MVLKWRARRLIPDESTRIPVHHLIVSSSIRIVFKSQTVHIKIFLLSIDMSDVKHIIHGMADVGTLSSSNNNTRMSLFWVMRRLWSHALNIFSFIAILVQLRASQLWKIGGSKPQKQLNQTFLITKGYQFW